jgi:hypothetical protein
VAITCARLATFPSPPEYVTMVEKVEGGAHMLPSYHTVFTAFALATHRARMSAASLSFMVREARVRKLGSAEEPRMSRQEHEPQPPRPPPAASPAGLRAFFRHSGRVVAERRAFDARQGAGKPRGGPPRGATCGRSGGDASRKPKRYGAPVNRTRPHGPSRHEPPGGAAAGLNTLCVLAQFPQGSTTQPTTNTPN